jgi:hypothetical protein
VRGQKSGQGLALIGLDQDGAIALALGQALDFVEQDGLANPGQSSQQQALFRPPRRDAGLLFVRKWQGLPAAIKSPP